jgi:predicted ester cyclase
VAEILETYIDGDAVICQVRWYATNSGTFRGAEPTNKKVDLRIAYFFNLKDGKIDGITEYYDLATLLMQQGQLEL